jgi:hypothetical protein
VVKATKVEGYDGKEVDDAERQWSVSGSLLYSITVITTIGQLISSILKLNLIKNIIVRSNKSSQPFPAAASFLDVVM